MLPASSVDMETKVSAVVIAKNEERTIVSCLAALCAVSDDVLLILDSSSSDKTAELAATLPVRIISYPWQGYSASKNYGASLARHPWILCLDADEVLDTVLQNILGSLKADTGCYYKMNIRTWFGSNPVRYCGWYPDWNIRLYNRQTMHWSSDFVHEKLVTDQKLTAVKLEGTIEHYSFADENHMKQKYVYYARLRAEEWLRSGRPPSLVKRIFGPSFRFFRTFILKLGILDGKTGWTIAKNEYILKRHELLHYKQLVSTRGK